MWSWWGELTIFGFFFADLVVLRLSQRKKSKNAISLRIIIFTRTTLQIHVCQLECKLFWAQLGQMWSWWGETSIFVFFLSYRAQKTVPIEQKPKSPISPRELNIFQNPFNTIFVNLNANLLDTGKVKRGLGEENLRFLVFFFCWFSGFAAITKKKIEKCHISKNNHFYSNYFKIHVCQLECKLVWAQLGQMWSWWGETSIFVFFLV